MAPVSTASGTTVFSTVRVPLQDRLPLWEEYNKRSLIGLSCRTLAADGLVAAQRNLRLPRLRFAEIRGNDHVVERSRDDIRNVPVGTLPLCLLLEGNAFYYHSDGCETLSAGDAILYDADLPFMYGFSTNMRQVILEVPRSLYTERTGEPGLSGPRVMRSEPGQPITEHARTAVSTIHHALQAPPEDPRPLEEAALDLFELITGGNGSSGMSGYLLSARSYIRNHLHRADLSVSEIARGIGISARHLARAFAAEQTTVGKELLETRLRIAADRLADPQFRSAAVGEIAASAGFASAAHFSRSFKQAYGHTPREARRP
ncbi:MAG TPA: AraC family transcriptional regulator [Arthrobacter sp.]|nr:AraC family transcriptional regulator [Arthrobacter sp.]